MNKDFDTEIISLSEKVKGGYTYLISNLSKIIAIITTAIAAMMVFTDITFLGINSREFSTTLVLILISAYVMYFSLEEAGERLYEDSDEYKSLGAKYQSIMESIGLDKLPSLRDYCQWYADEELKYRKRQMLLCSGLTEEEYKKSPDELSDRKKRRMLKRIQKAKRLHLTPELLLSHHNTEGEKFKDPKRTRLLFLTVKLLPSTICAFFTASVVLATKDLTLVSVLEGIMKLSMLPIIGFRGYVNGYNYKKHNEAEWIKTKIRLLEGFLEENENNNLQLT